MGGGAAANADAVADERSLASDVMALMSLDDGAAARAEGAAAAAKPKAAAAAPARPQPSLLRSPGVKEALRILRAAATMRAVPLPYATDKSLPESLAEAIRLRQGGAAAEDAAPAEAEAQAERPQGGGDEAAAARSPAPKRGLTPGRIELQNLTRKEAAVAVLMVGGEPAGLARLPC